MAHWFLFGHMLIYEWSKEPKVSYKMIAFTQNELRTPLDVTEKV